MWLPQGAWAGPVFAGMPSQRVYCDDALPLGQARYMESFESRHSDHALALAVAGPWVGGQAWQTVAGCLFACVPTRMAVGGLRPLLDLIVTPLPSLPTSPPKQPRSASPGPACASTRRPSMAR